MADRGVPLDSIRVRNELAIGEFAINNFPISATLHSHAVCMSLSGVFITFIC